MNKKAGITIVVLIVSACLLMSIALIVGGIFLLRGQKNYTEPTQVVTQIAPTAVPESTDVGPQPAGEENLPAEIRGQMDEIQQQVLQIRGKQMGKDLQRDLLTPEQLQEKVINDFFSDYTPEDAVKDAKILNALGLVDPGFDLRQFYLDLYSEQVAGYYDSETKEMYVISGSDFGGTERMTYAHEFNHVLQDQNYDLENGMKLNEDYCEEDTEYCAAVTALIEGDSVSAEQEWFIKHSTRQDQQDLFSFQQNYTSPVYDSAPAYMKEDFLFPYTLGFDFVQGLIEQGGWAAVDAAYRNPPVTTEQIIHPEKYPDDKPVAVEMPDLAANLDESWSELDRNVMGEWYTYLILARGRSSQFTMDDAESKAAAAGWEGDTYVYYAPEDLEGYLFAWRSTWETPIDAEEFFALSRDYGLTRWGIPVQNSTGTVTWDSQTEGRITMRVKESEVLWVMGSSESLVANALTLIEDFGN